MQTDGNINRQTCRQIEIKMYRQFGGQTGRQTDRQVTVLGDVGDASLHSQWNFSTKLQLVVQRLVLIGYRSLRRCFLIGQNIFQMDQPRLAAVVIFKSQMNVPTPGPRSTAKLSYSCCHVYYQSRIQKK